jgi:hypothetical protein
MSPLEGPTNMSAEAFYPHEVNAREYKNYFYNERTSSLAGPFSTDISAVALRENSSELYAVNTKREILKTDLLNLNDPQFPKVTDPINTSESFVFGNPGFLANEKGEFLYRNKYLETPFSEPAHGKANLKNSPLYFKDCYLSIAETNWMHFGSESAEKEVYRIDLSFHTNSIGHAWLYIQNDAGKVSGQYKGPIKEIVKVFTNLRGRRFKLKLFIATHENYPWAMREMAVGYNIGKSF